MDEANLKSALCAEIRVQLTGMVVQRHEDIFTSGVPDISLTGAGRTSWWEVKYTKSGKIRGRDVQKMRMVELDGAGIAFYLIYSEVVGDRMTRIIRPRDLVMQVGTQFAYRDEWMTFGISTIGFDHTWVIEQIRRIHSR